MGLIPDDMVAQGNEFVRQTQNTALLSEDSVPAGSAVLLCNRASI
jgi:hypothetical protein